MRKFKLSLIWFVLAFACLTGLVYPVFAANNFGSDPSCKALWRFESAALDVDSIGTNTLTLVGAPIADAVNFEEGAASILLDGATQYAYIPDASLSAGFPLNSGDTAKLATFTFRFRPESPTASDRVVIGKWENNNFSFVFDVTGLSLSIGWATSNTAADWNWGSIFTFTLNHWYRIAVIIDGATNKTCTIIIYDVTAGTYTYLTHTYSSALNVSTAAFAIGATADPGAYFSGNIDEVVAFNRKLNLVEIESIFNQIYTGPYAPASPGNVFTGDNRFQARWRFEAGALTTDSSPAAGGNGTNTLTLQGSPNPVLDSFGIMEGSDAAYLAADHSYFKISDSNLSAGFPWISSGANKKGTVCGWVIVSARGASFDSGLWAKKVTDNFTGGISAYIARTAPNHLFVVSDTTVYDTGIAFLLFGIYHVAFVIDNTNNTLHVRVYSVASGIATNYDTSIVAFGLGSGSFWLGSDNSNSCIGSWLDEFVVANALLSDAEIDAIREQAFPLGAGNYFFIF